MPLTLLYMFQCIPIQKIWQSARGPMSGHCMSKKAIEKVIIVQGGKSSSGPATSEQHRVSVK